MRTTEFFSIMLRRDRYFPLRVKLSYHPVHMKKTELLSTLCEKHKVIVTKIVTCDKDTVTVHNKQRQRSGSLTHHISSSARREGCNRQENILLILTQSQSADLKYTNSSSFSYKILTSQTQTYKHAQILPNEHTEV